MALVEFVNESSPYLNASNLNKIQEGNIYSTSEIEIGKWIDNKPIYRKVIDCGYANNGTVTVAHNIANIDFITSVRSFFYNENNKTHFPIPRAYPTNMDVYGVGIDVGTANITLVYGTNFNGTLFKTITIIEYTKTTD